MLVGEIVKKFGETQIDSEGRFVLSALSSGESALTVNYDLAQKARLGISHEDFCLSAFEGRLRISPEFLEDVEVYYDVSLDNCLQWVLDLENSGVVAKTGDIDFHVRTTERDIQVKQNGQTLAKRELTKEEG